MLNDSQNPIQRVSKDKDTLVAVQSKYEIH